MRKGGKIETFIPTVLSAEVSIRMQINLAVFFLSGMRDKGFVPQASGRTFSEMSKEEEI